MTTDTTPTGEAHDPIVNDAAFQAAISTLAMADDCYGQWHLDEGNLRAFVAVYERTRPTPPANEAVTPTPMSESKGANSPQLEGCPVWPDNVVADRHETTGKWVLWYLTDEQAGKCRAALEQSPPAPEAVEKIREALDTVETVVAGVAVGQSTLMDVGIAIANIYPLLPTLAAEKLGDRGAENPSAAQENAPGRAQHMTESEEDEEFKARIANIKQGDYVAMRVYAGALSSRLRQMDKRCKAANARADKLQKAVMTEADREELVEDMARAIYQADAHQGYGAITEECANNFAQIAVDIIKRRKGE